jgi:S-DNA-T family DNA segregation ATPase FtsK/SpoIIIE
MAAKKDAKKQNKSQAAKKAASGKTQKKDSNAREVGGIVCIVLGLFSVLTAFTKAAAFPKLFYQLICGLVGQTGFYILPVMLLMAGVILLFHGDRPIVWRVICAFGTVISVSALAHLFTVDNSAIAWDSISSLWKDGISGRSGGLLGGLLGIALYKGFSFGAYIILIALSFFMLLTSLNFSLASIFKAIKNRPRAPKEEEEEYVTPAERLVNRVAERKIERSSKKNVSEFDLPVDDPPLPEASQETKKKANVPSPDEYILSQREKRAARPDKTAAELVQEELDFVNVPTQTTPVSAVVPVSIPEKAPDPVKPAVEAVPKAPPAAEKLKPGEARQSAAQIADEIAEKENNPVPEYCYPPVELLNEPTNTAVDGTAEMRDNSRRLSDTLKCFGIEPHIVNVTRGPSVTRYEIELDRGVKLSKITNLADDIALSLGATGVRISAIPDKISVVGIEVPNKLVSTVYAREVIDSPQFRQSKSKISFAVGKDISGNCIVDDIAKLPHMLIAGTTGSGKSVCMNTLIISLLYKAKPDEVKLIMVDPKMVELGIYNGIPHLLIPVVTDPKKAAGALQWTVTEMMRRYRLMSEAGVRDLESYNKVVRSDPDMKPMEQTVVVIDELADLMLAAAKEVEESICRIAQMGRAAGIHLIIATQRPSADVITGLMKANIPSRIAFAVASAMESRIILDTAGAEKLVGKGDMLFAPLGKGKPKRVQGCFISEDEVQNVVNFVKQQSQPDYSEDILEQIEKKAEQSGKNGGVSAQERSEEDAGDELFPMAVEVILETGQASVSMLQRRLKLGYARAARIVDEMEEKGIVGPFEGSKPRQLLITKEQWEQMQSSGSMPAVEEELS